jgi:CxxC motif-containing protein (DUF1111 family)
MHDPVSPGHRPFAARAPGLAGLARRGLAVVAVLVAPWLVTSLRGQPSARAQEALASKPSAAPTPPPPNTSASEPNHAVQATPGRPLPGQPLAGLSSGERERFERGRAAFERTRNIGTGLGPVFNDLGCNRCHNRKGVGGAGIQSALLAGHLDGDVFDPLSAQGGSVLASNTLMSEPAADVRRLVPRCALGRDGEPAPQGANVVTRRRTTPLFGLGLVDTTPDAVFVELARRQPASIRGRVARVQNHAQGGLTVGKFGWKAQAPSVHQFSGLALLMELGVTSPEFPEEQAPFGDRGLLADCDAAPDPEDDGSEVAGLAEFTRLLAPVEPLAPSAEARAGDALFTRVGCDGCHVRRLTSGPSPVAALSQQVYAPFSDFLLHDMGSLGDGIAEGDAGPREMRTAPLWGVRLMSSSRLLHDGRARSFEDAIEHHDGQGARSRRAFLALRDVERQQLVAFLATL